MKTFLVKIWNTKNKNGNCIIDLINAFNESDIESIVIGKKYYSDSEKKIIYTIGKSFEVVREIIN